MEENIDEVERSEIEAFIATWQEEAVGIQTLEFTRENKMLVDLPANAELYKYFRLVDNDILNNIIQETNEYAVELFLEQGGSARSRISEWKVLTDNEFLKFLGLVYHMGTIKLNRIQDYWKTHRLFDLKCFCEQMSRERFLSILRCFHFSRNPKPNEPCLE